MLNDISDEGQIQWHMILNEKTLIEYEIWTVIGFICK